MTRKLKWGDIVDDVPPCPKCGSPAWIIDGDGEGRWWLLCLVVGDHHSCVQTCDLPEGAEVVDDVE